MANEEFYEEEEFIINLTIDGTEFEEVEVKVTEIDEKGRVNVSRKVLLPKPKREHK